MYDLNQEKLIIPGAGEVDMPGTSCTIHDAYDRGQRLFMTFTNFEGQHYLRIVTWKEGLDVRDIEMPWSGSFDTFHISPDAEDDDSFLLYLDVNEDFDRISASEVDGRWVLETINTGWDVIDMEDWGVRNDMNTYWAYGKCPWRDLETMDWNTLPMHYEDAVTALTHQGWQFAAQDTPLLAGPDANEAVLMTIPADTPLCLLQKAGSFALVGVQKQIELDYEADWDYDPGWAMCPCPCWRISRCISCQAVK